jgi:hypothetical protein
MYRDLSFTTGFFLLLGCLTTPNAVPLDFHGVQSWGNHLNLAIGISCEDTSAIWHFRATMTDYGTIPDGALADLCLVMGRRTNSKMYMMV